MKIRIETNFSGELYLNYLKQGSKNKEFFDGGFNQIENNFRNLDSNLYKNKYDIIVCHLTLNFFKDLSFFKKPYFFNLKNILKEIKNKFKFISEKITYFEEKNISIVFFNLSNETDSHYGYLETNSKNYSINKIINIINNYLIDLVLTKKNCYIFDFNLLVHEYGYKNIFDERLEYYHECPFSLNGSTIISVRLTKFIETISRPPKKVICLDLDNTLWGGVLGENSSAEIELSNEGKGKIYKDFQKELLNFKNRGVILTICSKNNLKDAEIFIKKHEHMVLKWDDFALKKINWKNKDQNIIETAKELNLGLDSFIFIDDNKHERNLIKNSLPQLEVFNFPTELTLLPRAIKQTESLKTFKVTDEDLLKTKQYAVELNRNELKIKMKYSDFLKSLNLKCEIEKLNKKNFTRFCQLILKVNQFNLTNIRYSDSQIKQMSLQKDIKMFTVKAEDKFGKLGIISVIILKILKGEVFIDTFLMSCRAIGKELEIFIINFIKQYVKLYFPKHILIGIFSKSKKNKYLVSKFYEQNEFSILKNKNNVKYFKCYDFKIKYPKHIKFLNLKKILK